MGNSTHKIIDQKNPGKYVLVADKRDYIEGIIEMTSSGNAYLLYQGKRRYYRPQKHHRSLDGDRVLVYQIKKRNNGKREGEVIEVLERTLRVILVFLSVKKILVS